MEELSQPITVNNTITHFNYSFDSLELDVKVSFNVLLFCQDRVYKQCILVIQDELYNGWGLDDDYIKNIIKNNINNILNTTESSIIASS